ncbi:uncharacterized protein LOC143286081 isoform X2 [Babylonia areolata]|uniref:uncharacterized protein LOC143286081 isoform X2 n=1 Tax=Babylonia areolata TaxID=304850 RepID=UPI003FD4A9AF
MATASVTASLWGRCSLLCCVTFLGCFPIVLCYTPEVIRVKCRDTIDLRGLNLDSGLVESDLPEKIPIYPHEDERCDMYLSFSEGSEMMFYFDDLELYSSDRSRCDSTNVEFFDGSDSTAVKGLGGQICGKQEEMPTGVYYVLNHLLIIRANSNGVVQGKGFRIHFTIYRRGYPCSRDEFSCEVYDAHSGSQGFRRCIDQQLVCDDWNDCGDWADEHQNCNDLTGGAIAAIVLVALGLIALVIGLVIFCKIRRQREIRRLGEKESAAVMRDMSFSSSRGGGGFMSPFSISNETLERDKYVPRYSTGRNSSRRGQIPTTAPGYEEHPPPYTEKPLPDESRSSDLGIDEDRPRTRQKGRRPEPEPDEVFEGEEEEPPRMRRGRSRSQEGRQASAPRDDRYPAKRDDDDPDTPRAERHSRDWPEDRRQPRDDRYPSRRDDRDSPPSRRDDRDRPASRYDDRDRPASRYDDRDRPSGRYDDRDRPASRYDDRDRPSSRNDQRDRDRERDRDRPRSRHDDRDRDRDRDMERDRDRPSSRYDDRDREARRERPVSRRAPLGEEEDDMMDQLHPLRERKRRSMHTDSDDPDKSREDTRDRPRRDDYDEEEDRRHDRSRRPRDSNDLHPPARAPEARSSSSRDPDRGGEEGDRPRRGGGGGGSSRNGTRGPDRQRTPAKPAPPPDDSYEDVQYPPPPRRSRNDSPPPPPPPPPPADPEDSPPRNRQRRSRSREGQDRPRSHHHHGEERERGGGRGRGGGEEEEGRRPRGSYGGFREESV